MHGLFDRCQCSCLSFNAVHEVSSNRVKFAFSSYIYIFYTKYSFSIKKWTTSHSFHLVPSILSFFIYIFIPFSLGLIEFVLFFGRWNVSEYFFFWWWARGLHKNALTCSFSNNKSFDSRCIAFVFDFLFLAVNLEISTC